MFNHISKLVAFVALLAVFANAAVMPLAATRDATLPITSNFSSYCDPVSINWYGFTEQTQIQAMCSTRQGGEGVLYESYISLSDCLTNNHGKLAAQIDGGATRSCSCMLGTQVPGCSPNCGTTQAQCDCGDGKGHTVSNPFSFDTYFGLDYDAQGHVVLSCEVGGKKATGTFTRCVETGDTVDCP